MSEEKEFVLNKLCIEKIKMREREKLGVALVKDLGRVIIISRSVTVLFKEVGLHDLISARYLVRVE